MPRSNREPEYRRRIREKTTQDQERAEAEERESADKNHREKLTAAIRRVEQELSRSNDEDTPHKKNERWWNKWEVLGLWAAAAVGIVAIWFGTHDAGEQRGVMQRQLTSMEDQLKEMQVEQRPYIGIDERRASLPKTIGNNFIGWDLVFTNDGKTPANYVHFTRRFIKVAGGAFLNDSGFVAPTKHEAGIPLPPGKGNFVTVVYPINFSDEEITIIYGARFGITLSATIEYQDKFKNIYQTDFCMSRLETSAIMQIEVRVADFVCKNEMQ